MYLKSLEIHGFKSFPNRTVMTFEPGTTVVVGPNGSGKSNISDAMRWVLGEVSSRSIRGTTMEDVIFGGTDTRKPMGYAEVTVTFDNTDKNNRFDSPYDEVTVTRRYYRGGTSEYLINNRICLRKEVHELFMNTGIGRDGYSIVGQGKVAEMISKKSEERRAIFEEAAGISKFRHRKHEAELKIANTQKNMDTTYVQIAMYEEQLVPLEKEAEKARRGEAIKEEKKAVDVALWLFDTKRIHEKVAGARRAYETLEGDLESLTRTVERLYTEREELEDDRTGSTFRSEGVLQNINELRDRLGQLSSRSDVIATEIAHANAMIVGCEARCDEIDRQIRVAEGEADEYRAAIAEREKANDIISEEKLGFLSEQQGILQRLRELEAELNASLRQMEELEERATDLRIRIDVLENLCRTDSDKCVTITSDIEQYEIARVNLEKEVALCERNVSGYQKKISDQDEIIADAETKIAGLETEKTQNAERIGQSRIEQNTKIRRANDLQRMMDQFDGYVRSVKSVMTAYEQGRIRGAGTIYGPLSQLVTIDPKYVTAIEMALGSSVQNIVTDTDQTAKSAIQTLKEMREGRATFLPVSTIVPGREPDEIRAASTYPGYINRADRLVSCDERFRPIVQWLLQRTVVFDTLDHAVSCAKALHHKVRFVSLDGQLVNVGGSLTGGSVRNEGTSILSRNGEIVALREEAEKLGQEIADLEAAQDRLDAAIRDLTETINDAKQNKDLMYTMSRTQFAALDSAKNRLEANVKTLERLREDLESLSTLQTINTEDVENKKKQLDALQGEIARLRAYREEVNITIEKLRDERDCRQEDMQALVIRATEIASQIQTFRTLLEHAEDRICEMRGERAAQVQKMAEYKANIQSLDHEGEEKVEEREEISLRLETLIKEREGLQASLLEFDKKLTELTKRIQMHENERNGVSRAYVESKTQFEQLSEQQASLSVRLHDEYGMSYEDAVTADYPPVTPENEAQMRQTAISCYNRLRNIGGYSPTAITDYLDIKAKYDEVNTQYTDLKTSLENLEDIIRQMEREMATTFVKSFEQINQNFGVVFRELFGGGSAELSLSEPDDVLNSGIEIKAAPPGKRIESLSLLSGGEQSFVAIALLFSILKLNPTPFCILDEVEAALDEVNVFRFGEYIKKFCSDTQFVLITHRRGTMQIADRLYGVTMPERGISKVICVDVSEIESHKHMLTDSE